MKPRLYAVDFGTSNSLLVAVDERTAEAPLALDDKARDPTVFRSILCFESGEWSFGAEALERYVAAGMRGRFLRSLKRFLPVDSFTETRIGSRNVKLEELVGIFLREMKQRADRHYGVDVRRVLLGRPARFADDVRSDALAEQRLEAAARFAGFETVHFCQEPVAAAYDFRSRLEQPKTVLIADFGGGTSDFAIARLAQDQARAEILATGGLRLAGDAFDGAIMRHSVARHFGAEVRYRLPFGNNVLTMPLPLVDTLCSPADTCLLARRDILRFLSDVRAAALGPDDRRVIDQLLCLVEDSLGFQIFEAIEAVKRELSESERASLSFEYPGISIGEDIVRTDFESYTAAVVSSILERLDSTLSASGLTPAQIDLVCCTGGTARVRALSAGIRARFGEEKLAATRSLHSVIQGLGERAKLLLTEGTESENTSSFDRYS
jgi:hypothetical chaperone protein